MPRVLLLVLLSGFSTLLAAQQDESTPAATAVPAAAVSVVPSDKTQFRLKDDLEKRGESKSSSDVGTMVIGLSVVLGLIFVLAWLSKRFNLAAPGGSSRMKLLSAMSVGPKEKIMLVEVEGEKLLLGVTSQQINRLASYDKDASIDDHYPEVAGTNTEFAQRMRGLLKAGVSNHE